MLTNPTLDDLRRYSVARSLFPPTTLVRAIEKLGFVQADPIRAPARAQDLTLRHRVKNYRAGDLERRYPAIPIEEGFFINYGFLPRADYLLMHPRSVDMGWDRQTKQRVARMYAFIADRGDTHPREVEAHFALGKATNYWGRLSNATTHLLGEMHYTGLLRVVRREAGIRVYAVQEAPPARATNAARAADIDALVDVVVRKYAPLPAPSLATLVWRLRYGTPQWSGLIKPALGRAKARLARATVDGVDWYWPSGERPSGRRYEPAEDVRLLSPFDPIVWDRRRFERLWKWSYRFEAYTPAAKRLRGHYALPLLWRDHVIGWGNVTWNSGALDCRLGFVGRRPRDRAFERALDAELSRMRAFLS